MNVQQIKRALHCLNSAEVLQIVTYGARRLVELEDEADIAEASAAIAEHEKDPSSSIPWERVKKELDALHGHHPAQR